MDDLLNRRKQHIQHYLYDAACDGFHVARLVQELQKWVDEFKAPSRI